VLALVFFVFLSFLGFSLVLIWLLSPVQLIDWKDSSIK